MKFDIVYLDSSVILRWLLHEAKPFTGWGKWQRAFVSVVGRMEVARTLDRLRITGEMGDEELATAVETSRQTFEHLSLIALESPILRRVELPFPTPIKTLDALHLATAEYVHDRLPSLVFVTHDLQQRTAARAIGLPVA